MTLNEVYSLGIKKFEIHKKYYAEDCVFELKACRDGMFYDHERGVELFHLNNWMSSFVIGLAPLFYRTEKNEDYLTYANRFTEIYSKKVFEYPEETMHDLGFLYSPFSVAAYQLSGNEEHKKSALRAAELLAKRFRENGKFIEAWEKISNKSVCVGRAIIDTMMNIPLLLWAHRETGDEIFKSVAVAHAETTRKYFIRDDGSVAHSFLFDLNSGNMLEESNTCGYSNGSYWARGTAWAIYGFAIMARYLNSREYYDVASRLALKYTEQFKENEYIPVWDFRLPNELPAKGLCTQFSSYWDESDPNNKKFAYDTSAAAIIACAFFELNKFQENTVLLNFAKNSLEALAADEYIDKNENVPALLSHQNGCMTYTAYGDFFLLQAIQVYLFNTETCW